MAEAATLRVSEGAEGAAKRDARLRAMFESSYDFIWRSLRRLGVPPDSVDDAAQEVFMVAARKLESIEAGRERSFLFGTAMRVASDARRARARRHEESGTELAIEAEPDPTPQLDELADQKRARELLDAVLATMPMDLRAVFVLYEIEGLSMADIAVHMELASGTVASRLRRGREWFEAHVKKLVAKREREVRT